MVSLAKRSVSVTDELVRKPRKRRKPMSPEQKAAAAERLAKAREKRLKEHTPEYKHVHDTVLAKPDDDPLSRKKVMGWIKENKEKLSSLRHSVRQNIKGAEAQLASTQAYIRDMESYLRNGVWLSMFYGAHEQHRMKERVIVNAYYHSGPYAGMVKRDVGKFYDDLGCDWTQEMDEQYYGKREVRSTSPTASGKKRRKTRK